MKKALLLVNIGSPDYAEKSAVKRFLTQFLNDKEVIDLPYLLRKVLVNLIIIPFRLKHSTSLYKKLWTKEGSPLIIYTRNLRRKLSDKLEDTDVFAVMRYGNPSLKEALKEINAKGYEKLTILPLYPQYATSTTKSTLDYIEKELSKWTNQPKVKLIKQFYDNPAFIRAICTKIQEHKIGDYEHIIFSYHALPNRQLNKLHPGYSAEKCTCSKAMPPHGRLCYKASCYQTTRLITKELGLKDDFYTTSFQSRMSKNWTNPFTTDTIIALAKEGKKNVLIVSPAFVTDCLETTVELAIDGQETFITHGGHKLQLVENLNDSDEWVDAICSISSTKHK
jgi:ferrochelatase